MCRCSQATSGRAITAEIVISDFVWDSDEDMLVEVYVSGAPFNRDITLDWELSGDESGVIESNTILFN